MWSLRPLRIAMFGMTVGGMSVMTDPILAEPEGPGLCSETSNYIGTFHAFGHGGACYQGAPNGTHTDYQDGYCFQYHLTCGA